VGFAALRPGPTVGNWIQVNERTIERLGYSKAELLEMTPAQLLVDPHVEVESRRQLAAGVTTYSFEAELRAKNGEVVPCDFTRQVLELDGRPTVLFVARDLSERRRLAAQKSAAYERLAAAEEIAQVGSIEWRAGTAPNLWSDQMYRLFGLEPGSAEPTFETFLSFVHPDDRERLLGTGAVLATTDLARLVDSGMPEEFRRPLRPGLPTLDLSPRDDELRFRIVRKDGHERTVALHLRTREAGIDGENVFLATVQDVTARERAAAALRNMTARAALAQERERRRIATELHDRTIQNLGFFRFRLTALREIIEGGPQQQQIDDLLTLTGATIDDARRLLTELSPPMLKELGLRDAIEWLAEGVHNRGGPPHRIVASDETQRLGEETELVLFQVARELLSNVEKHADAGAIDIHVTIDPVDENITLIVRDDGVGFDVNAALLGPRDAGGYGLHSIRESLGLLGGKIRIESSRGKGTVSTATVPLRLADEPHRGDAETAQWSAVVE